MDLAIDEFDTGMSWLCMANPFPPDLWGYVHGFGHQPEGSVAPLAHYNPMKVWQISLRRTW